MTKKTADSRELWDREYNVLHGIRMHFRPGELPAVVNALCDAFKPRPNATPAQPPVVLDIGCGKGRIGMHIANLGYRVVAFDFVQSAVDEFSQLAKEQGLQERVRVFQQDLRKHWNIPDNSIDAAVSATVFSNLIEPRHLTHVKAEMARVMRPSAALAVECFGPQDGYYGPLMRDHSGLSPGLLQDPNNDLILRLFTPAELTSWLAPEFVPVECRENRFTSRKYGGVYQRLTHICTFLLAV